MNNYLFIVSDRVDAIGQKVSGRQVYDFLMEKNAWGLHPTTQHRATLQEGDFVIFYLAGPEGGFLGTAVLASGSYIDKSGKSDKWWFNKSETNYRVDLKEVNKWNRTKPIQPLLQQLGFIKKTKNWGVYLQGGVRKISYDDYKIILESESYETEGPKEKSVAETIISFNPEAASYKPHSLKSPERIKINRLMENVEREWQIPNFQRYFDWNKEQIRSLLESIFNDYYVGSFLIWEAGNDASLAIEPIKGVSSNYTAKSIILDGQQRMTALYYAIKAPNYALSGKKKNYFYLDLRAFLEEGSRDEIVIIKDKRLTVDESYENLLFPFYELEKFHEWVYGFEEYLEKQTADKTQVRSIRNTIDTRLRHVWEGFEIPYVVLPETMDLIHVADIFEKINSSGKPLSTFDLLIARLLKYKIELKTLWDKARDDYQSIDRYSENEKTRMAVFQAMSLLYHPSSSCKRKDILNLYESLSLPKNDKSQFEAYWKTCVDGMNQAISRLENMRDGFGVRSEKDIPFMPALPMLTALIVRMESAENKADAYSKICQWYWSACITSAYSSGAESQMTADFREVTRWFDDESVVPAVVMEARTMLSNLDFSDIDEAASAAYRAVLSLVALSGAKDFVTGSNLENARENQKDHIFPKSKTVGFGKFKKIDSVLNMTWMSGETNMFIKRADKPSKYVPQFIKENFGNNEDRFIECLETHLINQEAFSAMKDDDIEKFFASRQEWIKKEFAQRIGGMTEAESKIEKNANGFIDKTEEKVRLLIDKRLSSIKSNYWDSMVPQGVREGVSERIAQHERKHPGDAGRNWTSGEKLSFCNIMDYFAIMSTKANWSEFDRLFGSRTETEKHFSQFNEYRNCVKHKREMNNVTKKLGEASLEWLDGIVT